MNALPNAHSKLIPFFCLFISGAASLTYELIWIRQLTLVFGSTLYAISAVLCAFMTGLALGAWSIGIFLDSKNKQNKPVDSLWLYGFIEGAIGLYALYFPYGLGLLAEWYGPLASESLELGARLHWIEFGISTALMLPATILMGATLPLIANWSIGGKSKRVIADVSILYSLNTFGAVAGCLYTQIFAINFFGINGTNLTAIMMNGLVFFLCVPLRKRSIDKSSTNIRNFKRTNDTDGEAIPERRLSFLLLLILFQIYELFLFYLNLDSEFLRAH